MLEAIQEILENIIKLAQFKSDYDRKVFETHIDPIYKNLHIVVDNYREILKDLNTRLQEPGLSQEAARKIVSGLIEQRRKHAIARAELKRYAKALKENTRSKEVQNFAAAVFDILDIEPVTSEMIEQFSDKPKTRTATTSLAWDLSHVLAPSTGSLRGVFGLIRHYETKIDGLWDVASQRYYELRSRYLK
jgi:hypothetical protein